MRILFIGGMYRGYRLAQRLLERGENVVGAYVYEEDPHESPKYAKDIASILAESVPGVRMTRRIGLDHVAEIQKLRPDVVFCLGWRTLIPNEALSCAPRGGVAVHDSLLPQLRGFAPTNWALILGHEQLGATLFQLTDSIDAGDVYFQQSFMPQPNDTYATIQSHIGELSVSLFDRYLDAVKADALRSQPQDQTAATYTCSRAPSDGEINWQASSESIERLVRALAPPAPGAFTYLQGESIVIADGRAVAQPLSYEGRIAGRVVGRSPAAGTVDVLCGTGILCINRVQTADGVIRPAASIIRSVRDSLGLNYSQEIVHLRDRLARMELLLERYAPADAVKKAG
jgi:methionyl-tRNA formyltransferase